MSAPADNLALSTKRSSPVGLDDDKMSAATGRMIRALGRRIAAADPDASRLLLELEAELRQAWETAVAGWRETGFSDGEIGAELGTTKQAVAQRWPREATS